MNSRRKGALGKLLRGAHFSGLLYGGGALLLVHLIGTLGYLYFGRPTATWIDSFYMTFITVATIGYAEVVDLSAQPLGRLFTVRIAVVGIATMSYLFSTLVALLVESDLNTDLRRRRMEKEIARLAGHYIVCGIGRVGTNVANELNNSEWLIASQMLPPGCNSGVLSAASIALITASLVHSTAPR